MDYNKLAELLFPDVHETPEDMEKKYPPRNLPEGAKVTRFAPSPTGFVHFGGLFPATVGERLAHQSGGVFYLRIEDTDAKREVEGAADALIKTLAHYGVHFDEGAITGLRVYTRHLLRHVSWPILGGVLTALTDETVQLFVPGRSGQVTDIWIDFSGVMTGLMVGLILLGLIRMCILLYKHRNED